MDHQQSRQANENYQKTKDQLRHAPSSRKEEDIGILDIHNLYNSQINSFRKYFLAESVNKFFT